MICYKFVVKGDFRGTLSRACLGGDCGSGLELRVRLVEGEAGSVTVAELCCPDEQLCGSHLYYAAAALRELLCSLTSDCVYSPPGGSAELCCSEG